MNKVILVGTVTRAAELRYLPTGTAVCGFTVTTEENFTDKQGNARTMTHRQPVVQWGKNAEALVKTIIPGVLVCVQGKLKQREWTDDANAKHSVTEVEADFFEGVTVLSGRNETGNAKPSVPARAQVSQPTPVVTSAAQGDDDEVPF